MMFVSFLLYILVCLTSSIEYRLPTTINPVQYNLTLHPFFNNFTFHGTASIDINISRNHVSQSSSEDVSILINRGNDMVIHSCSLTLPSIDSDSGNTYQQHDMTSMTYNNISQIVTLTFSVSESDVYDIIDSFGDNGGLNLMAMLSLDYSGLLRDDMKGWYISQYDYTPKDVTVYNAVTQFESTDARRAFPGWDEPSFKAVFKITIIAPTDATVLSNMNQVRYVKKKLFMVDLLHNVMI